MVFQLGVNILINWLRHWIAFLLLTNKSFRFFRWFGVHVTPVHFYSPIPDIRELDQRPQLWQIPSAMPSVEMQQKAHLEFMTAVIGRYIHECSFSIQATKVPYEYFIRNGYFGYVSAAAMHTIVRHYRPRRIVDVGAGFTTRVLAQAARMNAEDGFPPELIAIDPFPSSILRNGFPGLTHFLEKAIQDVDISIFTSLEADDILSIDTTHAVRTGGDVPYLYLELLPRLKPGVVVHIHDIFLPFEYPREWIARRLFWNEQYLLHAFLIYNTTFKPLWGQKYAEMVCQEEYARLFERGLSFEDNFNSYSFWLKRVA